MATTLLRKSGESVFTGRSPESFRKQRPEAIKNLFVPIGLVARELKHVTLTQLAFDGTRMRANSRRSGTRKVADLAESLAALAAKFAELQSKRRLKSQRCEHQTCRQSVASAPSPHWRRDFQ